MNKKIVVIDDDRVTLELLKRILSQNEFQVFGAADGKLGIELVRAEQPDIVICDLLIPKIHGLEVCQKVKEDPGLKKTKVMLMTATYKAPAFRKEIQGSGAEEFVEKPIDTIELMKKIYRLCIQIAEEEEEKPGS
jgi:DNA-binding response OmpR family regulator